MQICTFSYHCLVRNACIHCCFLLVFLLVYFTCRWNCLKTNFSTFFFLKKIKKCLLYLISFPLLKLLFWKLNALKTKPKGICTNISAQICTTSALYIQVHLLYSSSPSVRFWLSPPFTHRCDVYPGLSLMTTRRLAQVVQITSVIRTKWIIQSTAAGSGLDGVSAMWADHR